MIKNESIKKIIAEYEKAFAALGIRKNTEFFADAFISAGPRDAIAQSKAEFLKMHIKPQTSIKVSGRHLPES